MKQKFSTKWRKSKQKRKQRKYRSNAPLHIKHKMLSSNLSKELRKKYIKRSLPLRKNDVVKIMRGKFKKKKGKIIRIDLKREKVYVEGIQKAKKDGSKINVSLNASNLQIQELNLEDKKRLKMEIKEREKK
jgi:large subunit ribosomal protein L24